MKKTLWIILALVMSLTLVIGSVTTASAAPTKMPNVTVTVTRADVTNQIIYFTVSWKNIPKVYSFAAKFYYFEDSAANFIAYSSKVFTQVTKTYSSPEMSAVRSVNDHSFKSGDPLQIDLYLLDVNDNSVFSVPNLTFNAYVP